MSTSDDMVVNQSACDADWSWEDKSAQLAHGVPVSMIEFLAVWAYLATCVSREESHHELMGEGPRLASEVPHIVDLKPDLFPHLAHEG